MSPNKVLYEFYVKDYSVGTWELVQAYSESPTLNWTPRKTGQYRIELHVKDIMSSNYFDSNVFKDVTVSEPIAKANGLTTGSEFYINKSSIITGSATSPNKVLYEFYIKEYSVGIWELVQTYSESPTFNWTPRKAGQYRIELHVKDINSSKYFDSNIFKDVTVNEPAAKATGLTLGSEFYAYKSSLITGNATSPNKVLYEFYVKDYSIGTWELVQAYSESPTLNWIPRKAGQYRIELHVKDINSRNYFDSNTFKDVTVNEPAAKANGLTMGNEFYAYKNSVITGGAISPNKVLYEFYVKDYSIGTWELAQAYSESPMLNWIPRKAGQYRIELHVKDINSRKYFDSNTFKDVTVNEPTAKASGLTLDSEFYTNKNAAITGNATSPNKVLYEYYVKDYSTSNWELVQAYSESPTLNWTPTKPGDYRIELHVKDKYSKNYFDSNAFKDVTVLESIAKINSFSAASELYSTRNSIIAGSSSSTSKVLYEYYVKDCSTGIWELVQAYSESPTLNWMPTKPGVYRVELHVKDLYSSKYFDDNAFKDVIVYDPNIARNATISMDSNYNISATGISGNKVLYEFWVMNQGIGTWQQLQPYSESSTYSWKPDRPGRYRVEVHIKDINSKQYFDVNALQDFEIKPEGLIGNVYLAYSYYEKALGDFIDIQMGRQPALQVYNSVKKQYEWRYAQIKNEQNGYYTIENNIQIWTYSPDVYQQIKQQLIDNITPSNIINDDREIYEFLKLSYTDGVKASDLDSVFSSDGVLKGKGQVFIDASKANNINPIYLAAHAILETGNGKSQLATGVSVDGTEVYNLFGIHAYDSDPINEASKYAAQQGWTSIDKAIFGGANWISSSYINNPTYKQDTLYKMRWNPANPGLHQYATDIRWAYNQIDEIKSYFEMFPNAILVYDFPCFK